jgi:mannose-6-phosphate isomerase-like protein (cupin superfamily)
MPGYTLSNLRDVEDSAPKFGMAPAMQARFASRDLELSESGVSLQRLAANATQPFGHRHHRQEELYVVIDGGGRVKLDDELVELRAWDAIRVAPGVTRAFSAGPEGLEFLAFGAPASGNPAEDVDVKPAWWSGGDAG